MKTRNKFSLPARWKSIGYAFEGMVGFFKSEHNALIHLFFTVVVIVLSLIFSVTRHELIVLLFAIGFVWSAEIFNTAIERIMDLISTGRNQKIKIIKDLSAAAVLVAAITAFITGCMVFIPKL